MRKPDIEDKALKVLLFAKSADGDPPEGVESSGDSYQGEEGRDDILAVKGQGTYWRCQCQP